MALGVSQRAFAAEPTAEQKQIARDLMDRGRASRAAHDLKGALASFQGADDIMHVPTTGFEVARSQVDLGLLVEAHDTLQRVSRIPQTPGESSYQTDARGYAKVLDDEVMSRVPKLHISVSGAPADAVIDVSIDGVAIPAAALAIPAKVDPGHHVITAKASGMQGEQAVDVGEKQERDVSVVLAATTDTPTEPVLTTTSSPPPTITTVTPDTTPKSSSRFTTLTWIGFGAAATGLLVGGVTGFMSISAKGSATDHCNGNRCPPSTYDDIDRANTFATVSTISFVVAGVGACVGAATLLFGGSSNASASAHSAHVTPWIGVGSAGVAGAF